MLSIILTSLSGIITFILLDYIWLARIAKDFYLSNLASHVTITNGSLVPYLPAVPLVYLVGIGAVWVFILSWVTDLRQAALYGAALGFFMYAFYDLTNIATLRDYSWSLTIVDIIWGTILVSIVTTVMFYIKTLLA